MCRAGNRAGGQEGTWHKMEMKNVLISIRGLQQVDDGDDGDAIELLTDGHYGYADGRGKLVYMESELTGLKGTRTTFLVEPTGVVLEREGEITSHMVFEPGKKHLFLYETPFGAATMDVNTERVYAALDEHGGDLEIHYRIGFENTNVGKNRFRIHVQELKS